MSSDRHETKVPRRRARATEAWARSPRETPTRYCRARVWVHAGRHLETALHQVELQLELSVLLSQTRVRGLQRLALRRARPPATRPQTKSPDPLDLTRDLRTIFVAANPDRCTEPSGNECYL